MRNDPASPVRRSLKWAFALTWGQRGINTLATLVLASLLGPSVYGTVGMALVYLAFLQLFLDQGIKQALVQREDLADEDLDAAFWINVAWSIGLAALSVAASGLWARITRVPELAGIIDALSVTLLVRGLTIVQEALAQRELRFRALALRSNVGSLVGAVTGIVVALAGAGVWSLVAQQLAAALASALLLWSVAPWWPRWRFSRAHAQRIIGFSAQVFAGNLGVFLQGRIDELLLGVFFGPRAAGLYRLADRIMEVALDLASRPVQLISLAHLARLQQDPPAQRDMVLRFLHATSLTAIPTFLMLAALADHVMAVVGPAWAPAGAALRLLCLAGIARSAIRFTGPLLTATARPRLRALLVWGLAAVSVPVFLAVAWWLRDASVEQQVAGMAGAAATLSLFVLMPASLGVLLRITGLTPRPLLRLAAPSSAAGIAALLAVGAVTQNGLVSGWRPLWALALLGAIAILAVAIVLLALERDLRAFARGLAMANRS